MEERQEKSTHELAHEPAHDVGRWLETPRGRYVMGWERPRVDAQVADVFGYNALQLGLPQVDFLAHNRIPVRQIIGESGAVDVRCTLCELPFASASIDLVVMPHVLEFHDDPHQILREVERILIPDGQIVITGFNPISLWGLRRIVRRRRRHFPDNGDFISVLRLRDWLRLLGFEVDRGNFDCYVLAFLFVWYISNIFQNPEPTAPLCTYQKKIAFVHQSAQRLFLDVFGCNTPPKNR